MSDAILVVGLGNPGLRFVNTRHNIGYIAVDELSHHIREPLTRKKMELVHYTDFVYKGRKIILSEPQTFMNLSGKAVSSLKQAYGVDLENILVIYDDCDLPLGKIRIRKSGSAGGHNGIKSIIEHIGNTFPRIRIGIGACTQHQDLADYVLSPFSIEEKKEIDSTVEKIPQIFETFLLYGLDATMNEYNRKN